MEKKAKKFYGQHFLHHEAIARRIVEEAASLSRGAILEIGPGRGALTRWILQNEDLTHLVLVEKDRDMESWLKNLFKNTFFVQESEENFGRAQIFRHTTKNFTVSLFFEDILDFDFSLYPEFLVLGNLPYNVSVPILFRCLKAPNLGPLIVMVQKEVAKRICALEGAKDYGRLSVMMQSFFQVKSLFDVSPGSFTPAPKITSSVVRLLPTRQEDVKISTMERFLEKAFSQRRKMLKAVFPLDFFQDGSKENLGISVVPTQRPQDVSVKAYCQWVNSLSSRGIF